ncbi:SMP-30/gluconolactonase/LRE family protein [Maricaulis sp.]|uniref:SMP-30/gluconolactonase/LRE family protein n=1 Tax=Maricaulis sp. TaxID=1486257 RepID=UPI003A8CF762
MKSIWLAAGLALLGSLAHGQSMPQADALWRSENVDRPEAVHVPVGSDWAYIGNQSGAGEETDPPGQGYVSRLNLETGEWQARWADGFDDPLGIVSQDGLLYMVDAGRHVVALDTDSGEELDRWTLDVDNTFLNDIAIDPDGRIWVTDTRGGRVFGLVEGAWRTLFEGAPFTGANGIEYVDGWIYIVCSSGVGNLIRVQPDTLATELLLEGEGSLDGVVTDGRGGLVLSDLRGRLLHWSETAGLTVLDGFEDEDIMLNSIGGTPDGRFIFAPHWSSSQLSAYEIHYPAQ